MISANDIIKKAISQIGVKENPPNSNKVKYNTDYYGKVVSGSAYPWCCAFVWWVFKECKASNVFCGGKKTAYCPTVESYYKSKGQYFTSNPKVGDLVLFEFNKAGRANHIGILEKINADGTYTCIEGNTSVSSDNNGGAVMRRVRKQSVIRGFARPNYDGAKATTTATTQKEENKVTVTLNVLKKGSKGKQVQTLQRLLVGFGFSVGSAGVDGDFGSSTLTAVKAFQKGNALAADGIVGQKTWEKLLI